MNRKRLARRFANIAKLQHRWRAEFPSATIVKAWDEKGGADAVQIRSEAEGDESPRESHEEVTEETKGVE